MARLLERYEKEVVPQLAMPAIGQPGHDSRPTQGKGFANVLDGDRLLQRLAQLQDDVRVRNDGAVLVVQHPVVRRKLVEPVVVEPVEHRSRLQLATRVALLEVHSIAIHPLQQDRHQAARLRK